MRDINEQISSGQHSRAKLKQRLAGGAVLLIVLGIFLPFIFKHSHQSVNSTLPTDNTPPPVATQAPPVAAPAAEQQAAPPAPQTQAQNETSQAQTQNETQPQTQTEIQPQAGTAVQSTAATESVPAPVASVQPAAPTNVATPAPSSSAPSPTVETTPSAAPVPDKSMSSDQPGLTALQSETALPETSSPPAPQQTQPTLSSQPEPAVAAPVAPPAAVVVPPAATVKSHAAARVLPPPSRTVAKVAPTGHWVVQVGSFAQPEYAQQLAGKLRASGFPVFTQLGAKQLTRVYIGPIASQQQAQKIQQRVQDKFQISGLVRETRH